MTEGAWNKDYSKRKELWKGITNFEFGFPKNSKVLELGCGNGKTLLALTNRNLEIHAIDYSEKAVELCKQIVPANEKITIRKMNAINLEYDNEFFDFVICFHVLAHELEAERKKIIQEITRVLKKNGKVYFRDFGISDFRFGMKGVEVEKNTFKRHTGILTHYFTKKEVEELFKDYKNEWFFDDLWKVKYDGLKTREELNFVFAKN
ncbi:Ubiquinone/menaquinone biosynthesis C-methyltransferase UbiE [uncultured archaeon]|nr:Ubiquinone/menaquinone biosynthesis C-methyltransferase UbiE [uncultured archaeon]